MISSDSNSINLNEKRIKKSVERLSEFHDIIKDRKLLISSGNGTNLGDIERVKDAFNRTKIDKQISKYIYLLCYKARGQASKRNGDIKKFNGFSKDDDSEIKKRLMYCEKIPLGSLRIICDLFNIPSTGKQKKDLSMALVTFLQCPIETGSKVFRTAVLRRKIKNKSKPLKSNKKELAAEVSDEICVKSLSESSSEEIVIAKTRRLESKDTKEGCETIEIKELGISKKVEVGENIDNLSEETKETSDEKSTKMVTQIDKIAERILKRKKLAMKTDLEQLADVSEPKKSGQGDITDIRGQKRPRKKKLSAMKEEMMSLSKNAISDDNYKCKIMKILKEADLTTTTLNQVCDKVIDEFPGVDLIEQRCRIKELVKKVIEEN